MAIVHKASVSPTKAELLERAFEEPVTMLGTYRCDDPRGEVGVEAFIVRSSAGARQIVLTYHGAPLEAAGAHLMSTMEHSVLGRRWIYHGTGDRVAIACFRRALLGEHEQAVEEMWDNGRRLGIREPTVRLSVLSGQPPGSDAAPTIATDLDLPVAHTSGSRLRAAWNGGDAIVASVGQLNKHSPQVGGSGVSGSV